MHGTILGANKRNTSERGGHLLILLDVGNQSFAVWGARYGMLREQGKIMTEISWENIRITVYGVWDRGCGKNAGRVG